jgi:tetratricopeptide (TPR) repeat protein
MSDASPDLIARLQVLEDQYAENPAKFFMSLASALREVGEAGRAEEVLRENLKRHPGYLSAHVLLGRCLVDRGARDEATNEFQYVLSVDPQNLVALRFLAEIAAQEGRTAEAERWYTELLSIDPMNSDARRALAEMAESGADASTADQPLPAGAALPGGAGAAPPADESDAFGLVDLDEEHAEGTAPAGGDGVDDGVDDDHERWGELTLDAPDYEPAGAPAPEEWPSLEARQEPAAAAAGGEPSGGEVSEAFELLDEPADVDVYTETMAELYASQGMPDRAAEVYRQLILQRGETPALARRLAELEGRAEPEPLPEAPAEEEQWLTLDEPLSGGGWDSPEPSTPEDGSWLESVDAFARDEPEAREAEAGEGEGGQAEADEAGGWGASLEPVPASDGGAFAESFAFSFSGIEGVHDRSAADAEAASPEPESAEAQAAAAPDAGAWEAEAPAWAAPDEAAADAREEAGRAEAPGAAEPAEVTEALRGAETIGEYFRALLTWSPGAAAAPPEPAPPETTAPEAAEVDPGGFTLDEPETFGTEGAGGGAASGGEEEATAGEEPLPWELPPEPEATPGTPTAPEAGSDDADGFSFEDFFGEGGAAAQPEAAADAGPQSEPEPEPWLEGAPQEAPPAAQAAEPEPAPPALPAQGEDEDEDEDLESFQAWLQSLKR